LTAQELCVKLGTKKPVPAIKREIRERFGLFSP
jgi:hypothetical protein